MSRSTTGDDDSPETDPYSLERGAVEADILRAIRESPESDTSVSEIADCLDDREHSTVRKHVVRLRERGEVEVTRQVGPAKLYRTVD